MEQIALFTSTTLGSIALGLFRVSLCPRESKITPLLLPILAFLDLETIQNSANRLEDGVYASGNGTAYIKNVQQFSGGRRSSSFSGDSPAGYVYVEDSVAHTTNIGSAIFYALGDIFATNVAGHAEKGPVVFMDGKQRAYLTNCDVTAGLLGGVALFSSQDRQSGAVLSLDHTRLTATNSIPGLWFGNTIINVTLHDSEVINDGVLVVANFSQITQDFDHYAGYSEQPNLQPAEVYVSVTESELTGDLVALDLELRTSMSFLMRPRLGL